MPEAGPEPAPSLFKPAQIGSMFKETLQFNLQILPESIVTGLIVLSIVLANYTLTVMGIGAVLTQIFTAFIGATIFKNTSTAAAPGDGCTGGFYGLSPQTLFNPPDIRGDPLAPSIYMATIGYFFGYGLGLQQIYYYEIERAKAQTPLIITAVVSALLVVLALIFRIGWFGCDTYVAAACGTLLGLALGYFGSVLIAYFTGRRATNVWGLPLLQDRINSGSAVYMSVDQ
jgi:hypothetical protein